MLGLMHDHPYVFTPTIAKIMLPVWVCLLVSTVRAIRRDMKKERLCHSKWLIAFQRKHITL